jgi:hypothetical protein
MKTNCSKKNSAAMTFAHVAAANASKNAVSNEAAFDGVNREHYF